MPRVRGRGESQAFGLSRSGSRRKRILAAVTKPADHLGFRRSSQTTSYLLNGHPAEHFQEVLATAEANSLRVAAERGGSWPAEVERYWLRFEHAALVEFLRIRAMPKGGAA